MLISVNGVEVSEEAVNREMQYHPADSRTKAWLRAAQSLTVKELLIQRAQAQGIYSSNGDQGTMTVEDAIDALLQKDIEVPEADRETCQRYYEAHPKAFMSKEDNTRLPFAEAEQWVRHYLHTKAMRAAVSEYIKALAAEADIQGVQLTDDGIS